MKEVLDFIKKSKKVAVLTHINPDGDALGSAHALSYILNNLGKKAEVLLLCNPPLKYDFDDYKYKIYSGKLNNDYDSVISVDCATLQRLGNAKELFSSCRNMNIDHHISNSQYGDVNYVKQTSSTGEIIYELSVELDFTIDSTIAVPLYIAIASDTGIFTYSNTTKTTFEIASALAATNFDIVEVADKVFNSRSYGGTKLISKFIDNIRMYHDSKLAISILTLQDLTDASAALEDCETVINYARDIEGVEIAAFIREIEKDTYKVSLRSKKYADVQDFASRFGGGGHKRASGFLLKDNIFEVVETVIRTSRDYLE